VAFEPSRPLFTYQITKEMMTIRLFVIKALVMLLLSSGSLLAQNTRTVTQKGSDHRELILQYGDGLTVDLLQYGAAQQALVIQRGEESHARLRQSGHGNLARVLQLLEMDAAGGDSLRASQAGNNNRLFLLNLRPGNTTVRQTGSGNAVMMYGQADSTRQSGSRAVIRQSGNGNSATVIQN